MGQMAHEAVAKPLHIGLVQLNISEVEQDHPRRVLHRDLLGLRVELHALRPVGLDVGPVAQAVELRARVSDGVLGRSGPEHE